MNTKEILKDIGARTNGCFRWFLPNRIRTSLRIWRTNVSLCASVKRGGVNSFRNDWKLCIRRNRSTKCNESGYHHLAEVRCERSRGCAAYEKGGRTLSCITPGIFQSIPLQEDEGGVVGSEIWHR